MIKKLLNSIKFILSFYKTQLLRHFPFLWSHAEIRPRYANINITDRCCFRCVMCEEWKNMPKDELTTQEWKDFFGQLKKAHIKEIILSGGEPLLRDDLPDLIRYANGIGFKVSLVTNGYLLDEGKLDALVSSGIASISISVDGIGNDFESVRGVEGSYQKVEKACFLISELARKKKIHAAIGFVLMKGTSEYLDKVLELRNKLNIPLRINLVDFTPYFFKSDTPKKKFSFWINNEETISKVQKMLVEQKNKDKHSLLIPYSAIDFIKEYFKDPLQKDKLCVASKTRICVDSCGNIFGGCWSMESLGNIKKQSLKEILSSRKYIDAQKRMFFKNCPGCSCGYVMNLYYSFSSLMSEFIFVSLPFLRKKIYAKK